MNLATTLALQNLRAEQAAGSQATYAISRTENEQVVKMLDEKRKRLEELDKKIQKRFNDAKLMDLESAIVQNKKLANQDLGLVPGTGPFLVVDADGLILSRWETREQALKSATGLWKGLSPSSTGATAGTRIIDLRVDKAFKARFLNRTKVRVTQQDRDRWGIDLPMPGHPTPKGYRIGTA